jgi:hypothetical protein
MPRTFALRNSRDDKAVKFLEFMRLHARDQQQLCCFFEGDDAKYYCVRIATILPGRSWSPINCRGKEQVLELYGLISKHADYSKARTAFFVDRDFDPPLLPDIRARVYETPCYSVENFYSSMNCFSQVLKSEFGITDGVHDGTVLKKCCDLYQTTQQLFHDAITELNAWLWIQRNHHKNVGSLNLRNVKFDRFVAVGLGAVTKLYSIFELKDVFPEAPIVDEALLASKIAEFQTADRGKSFRGKYEVEFLRLVLGKLAEDYRNLTPNYFPFRGTVRLTLSRENLISELSQYADTPNCLRDYLLSLN